MKILRAALFPGQGSLGADGPVDTAHQQPAIFKRSVESWRAAALTTCDWFAGHSLGAYGALVAAGALDGTTGERIVAVRGKAMAEAAEQHPGGMVALLGCDLAAARDLAGEYGLTVANDNAPGQVVLSGALDSVDALEQARPTVQDEADGSERAIRLRRLTVSGPFHTSLMEAAAERLAVELAEAEFGDAAHVVANGTARPYEDPRRELAHEVMAPVRWRESLEFLWRKGVREFIEFEPAGVLAGLVKRTLPAARVLRCSDLLVAGGTA